MTGRRPDLPLEIRGCIQWPPQQSTNTNGSTVTNYTYAGTRNDERLTAGSITFLNGSLGITQQTKTSGTTSFIRDPDGTLISMRDSAGASYDSQGRTLSRSDDARYVRFVIGRDLKLTNG